MLLIIFQKAEVKEAPPLPISNSEPPAGSGISSQSQVNQESNAGIESLVHLFR